MTVGLVIVSHSAKIAEGVVELAAQMAPSVAIVAAGGTDDGGIGTSFDKVQAAFQAADSGSGIVVLCDLGSAVLTTETALEFAQDAERIRIADAPIVEGAVAASVAAESGAGLEQVLAAAQDQAPTQAADAAGDRPSANAPASGDPAVLDVELQNEHGLHARPAAELVRAASAYDARVTVNGVDATSMLRVLGLGLAKGDTVRFEATGTQAAEVLAAIGALAADGFGE